METPTGERGQADTLLGALLLLGFLLAVVAAAWSFGLFRTVRSVYLATLEERARLAEAGGRTPAFATSGTGSRGRCTTWSRTRCR